MVKVLSGKTIYDGKATGTSWEGVQGHTEKQTA